MELDYLKYVSSGLDRDAVLMDLMNAYGNDVWNFAFFLVRRADAADDISQEVFLAAYDKLYTYRGEAGIRSWLLAITRNKSYKHNRSAFLTRIVHLDYAQRRGTARSAEAEAFDRLETRHIWDTVMRLPLRFREVILLDAHYQLPLQDISAMLRVPEGTVKSRLHRARKKLSALLNDDGQGEDER